MSELTVPADGREKQDPHTSFVDLCRLMRQDIRNNFGWTRPGSRALLVYRLGAWLLNDYRYPCRALLLRFHLSMERFVRNAYGIELSRNARIGRGFVIAHQNGIVIHDYAVIGDDCIVRQGVTMGIARANVERVTSASAPLLGDRVDVGAGAVIMGAVQIGSDVRIFPNAVVMTNVPANTTVMPPTSRLMTMKPESVQSEEPQ